MDLKGIHIQHKAFGEGVVKAQSGDYIIVSFGNEDKQFTYPDAYGVYFSAVEPEDDAAILAHINALQARKDAAGNAARKKEFMRRLQERHAHKD